MLKIKTYKYRPYPTKKQALILTQTLDACRILYNSCIVDGKNVFENTVKGLARMRQQEILKSDKSKINSLNGIHSEVPQNVLFRVEITRFTSNLKVRDTVGKKSVKTIQSGLKNFIRMIYQYRILSS